MTTPRIPPLPRATRALLSRERALPAADPSLRQRVLERARAELEERRSGVELRRTSNGPLRPSWRLSRNVLLMAATLALASLAAAGARRLYALEQTTAPVVPPALSTAPASQEPEPAAARFPVRPLEVAATAARPVEPPRTAAAAGEPTRVTSLSTYAFELRLLEPARRNIAGGNFSAALSAILRHQREYPRGQLVEEREALRVRALWGMGARSEAQSAAVRFRQRYPHSGLLSWMKAAAPSP